MGHVPSRRPWDIGTDAAASIPARWQQDLPARNSWKTREVRACVDTKRNKHRQLALSLAPSLSCLLRWWLAVGVSPILRRRREKGSAEVSTIGSTRLSRDLLSDCSYITHFEHSQREAERPTKTTGRDRDTINIHGGIFGAGVRSFHPFSLSNTHTRKPLNLHTLVRVRHADLSQR